MAMEHLLTSEEVAEFLHVDPVTVRRLITKNELSAYRIGSDYRIAPNDLTNYLTRQRVVAEAEQEGARPLESAVRQLNMWVRKRFQSGNAMDRDRFDKFTERARKVMSLAQAEAHRLQHNYIGTEHLLLGLVSEGGGVAALALQECGVTLERVRADVEEIIGIGDKPVIGLVGLTPRAKKVIELAVDEARRMSHRYIGTEHILLGLIREGEGIAAGVLTHTGLSLNHLRQEVLRILSERGFATPLNDNLQEAQTASEPTDSEPAASEPTDSASAASEPTDSASAASELAQPETQEPDTDA
ncbi:helix-turn-helix domain-containing protein [Ktedonobacteria bacterium brp13]|nr:helix-turn-helix domain-containing protein [Ktedonobacteria bacterium brp13]